MRSRTFTSPSGKTATSSDKKEITMMIKCGWKEVKAAKIVFSNGETSGNRFINK